MAKSSKHAHRRATCLGFVFSHHGAVYFGDEEVLQRRGDLCEIIRHRRVKMLMWLFVVVGMNCAQFDASDDESLSAGESEDEMVDVPSLDTPASVWRASVLK